jgi:hypothetical protein
MFKMGSYCPYGHLKHKLWSKEKLGVKLAVWLPTIKSRTRPDFLICRQGVIYRWKTLDEGYNFAWDLITIKGLQARLWAPKVMGIPVVGISGLPLGSPKTKNHLDVAHVDSCRVYYEGEGVGFP